MTTATASTQQNRNDSDGASRVGERLATRAGLLAKWKISTRIFLLAGLGLAGLIVLSAVYYIGDTHIK